MEQVQRVVDGVKLLIEMEKRLEAGKQIEDLVPQEQSKHKLVSNSSGRRLILCVTLVTSQAQSTFDNFPDLSKHNNWMAKCLTKEIYENLKDKTTSFGQYRYCTSALSCFDVIYLCQVAHWTPASRLEWTTLAILSYIQSD